MRLLLIAGSFAPFRVGGPALIAERLGVELARRGHRVAVLTSVTGSTLRYEVRGVPVIGVAPDDVARVVPDLLTVLRPDIVHAHSPRFIGPVPLRLAQEAGLPTVASIYGAEPALPSELLRAARAVVADTPTAAHVRHIPNGALPPGPHWVRPPRVGPPRLGFLGGPSPEQGLGLLISALQQLRRSDYVLRVVDRASLLGQRGIRERDVHVPGLVRISPAFDPWQAEAFYGSIDTLISLPQTPGHVNLAVRDAMAHGVWPIATDVPANAAVINPGADGELVPVGAVPGLAAAIGRALDRSAGPGPAAVPTVADQAAALESLYAELLAA